MNSPIDTAELRRLWEAAMQETSTPQDLRKSMNAAYLPLPALLDELEAAREEAEKLRNEESANSSMHAEFIEADIDRVLGGGK